MTYLESLPPLVTGLLLAFILVVVIMWLFLPLAVFGVKQKLNEQKAVLERIEKHLKTNTGSPAVDREPTL